MYMLDYAYTVAQVILNVSCSEERSRLRGNLPTGLVTAHRRVEKYVRKRSLMIVSECRLVSHLFFSNASVQMRYSPSREI